MGDKAALKSPIWSTGQSSDSKDPDGAVHCYSPHEWTCFLDGARNGEFNRAE
jgi:hypothetical protein